MKSAILGLLFILTYSQVHAEVAEKAEVVPAASEVDTGKDKNTYVICRNDKAVRTIRVDLQGPKCRAIYTKEGKDSVVAKSGTPDLCYDVVSKIRLNLEKSVWKCKDVNPDRVSFTQE